MTENIKELNRFKSISLPELNSTSSFLKRIDRKYLLTIKQLSKVLLELENNFKILEIGGNKIFNYDNVYMDTKDYLFYKEHQEKKTPRTKIRTRYYVESNLAFFEYKRKEKNIINKYRYEFPPEEHGFMTRGKKRFFDGVWQSMYKGEKAPDINPSIKTTYKRITMVSNSGEERITIDFDIKVQNLRDKRTKAIDLKNLVIFESKSLGKGDITKKIMKSQKLKKAKSCSKYSLGIIYSGLTEKYDTFAETIEKIKEIRMETIKNKKRNNQIKEFTKRVTTKANSKIKK